MLLTWNQYHCQINIMAEELYESEQENCVKPLIPKPLELLPEREESILPKFAVEGLSLLSTDCRFRSQEQIYDFTPQKASSKVGLVTQPIQTNPFKNTIYQKYQSFDNSSPEQKCIITCRMSLKGDGEPEIRNKLTKDQPRDEVVRFDSRFESGNLGRVSRLKENQYNLLIDNDINTGGFTQWFFFKVEVDKPCKIKFNILNFRKKHSLYEKGMKVCVYSEEANKKQGDGWTRGGTDIKYFKNDMHFDSKKSYYTLSFTYKFKFKSDKVYFSYHYPYTFSDLLRFYKEIEDLKFVKRSLLCLTPCNNKVHCLTITENNTRFRPMEKKYVFLISRTHPGETISSLMIERVVKYLTSNEKEAVELRHAYVFKIIAMVNPDGVLHGNSRCSLPGRDLNRSWDKIDQYLFPQIYHIKKMVLLAHKQNKVHMICDFHGHSLKKDAFIYGCHKKSNPFATREFPWILSKLCKNFSYRSCAFTNSTDKFGTARVSLFKILKLPNIYTLETSFCGPNKSSFHWSEQDLNDLSKCFCQALYALGSKPKPADLSKQHILVQSPLEQQKEQLLKQLYKSPVNYECNLKEQYSNSDIQEDYIDINFNDQEEVNHIKKSQPLIVNKRTLSSKLEIDQQSFTPQKLLKGGLSLNKILKKRAQSERIDIFDSVKFWADNQQVKPQHKNGNAMLEIKGKRRQFYSRTQIQPENQQVETSLNRIKQIKFDMKKMNYRIPKTLEKKNNDIINNQVVVITKQAKSGKSLRKDSTISILKNKVPQKYVHMTQIEPRIGYERLNCRTQMLKKRDGITKTINQSAQNKIFEKELIQKIDRHLQNYIEVHRLNKYYEGSGKFQ